MMKDDNKFWDEYDEKGRASDSIRDEALSIISHELLTPINSIAGWTKILQNENVNEQTKRQAFLTIEKQIDKHTKLVDELIAYSKIYDNHLELYKKPTEFSPILKKAIAEAEKIADEKNIEINIVNFLEGESLLCQADLIHKALINILFNAIKFTDENGRIEISVYSSNGKINLCVKDNGAGIERKFLPNIFDEFKQADSSTTRKFRGLGLGLAITRQIIRLHQGEIEVKSEGLGKGTEVFVELPFVKNTEQDKD